MVVQGSFTPSNGTARDFTVYFDAKIKVKLDLDPRLTIPGAETITVSIDPSLWFQNGGQVMDLVAADGKTLPFELEMRRGFRRGGSDD